MRSTGSRSCRGASRHPWQGTRGGRTGGWPSEADDFAIATHSQLGQAATATWSFAMGQIIRLPVSPAGYPDSVTSLDPAECTLLIAVRWWVVDCLNADD